MHGIRAQVHHGALGSFATVHLADPSQAPLKGPWRALEKMVLRPAHKAGGELDASLLCDCLRGALNCKDFTVINSVVELMTWLDNEMGDESRCEGIERRFRIRIIRIKCRFSLPTWRLGRPPRQLPLPRRPFQARVRVAGKQDEAHYV